MSRRKFLPHHEVPILGLTTMKTSMNQKFISRYFVCSTKEHFFLPRSIVLFLFKHTQSSRDTKKKHLLALYNSLASFTGIHRPMTFWFGQHMLPASGKLRMWNDCVLQFYNDQQKIERVAVHLYIIYRSSCNKGIDPLKEIPSINSAKREWSIKRTDGS